MLPLRLAREQVPLAPWLNVAVGVLMTARASCPSAPSWLRGSVRLRGNVAPAATSGRLEGRPPERVVFFLAITSRW